SARGRAVDADPALDERAVAVLVRRRLGRTSRRESETLGGEAGRAVDQDDFRRPRGSPKANRDPLRRQVPDRGHPISGRKQRVALVQPRDGLPREKTPPLPLTPSPPPG